MKRMHMLLPALGLMLGTAASAAHAQYGPPPPPPQGYAQGGYGQGGYGGGGGWEAPPSEFAEAMRHGFHDGIEGARRDFQNHRPPSVENRDEFRHPPVGGPDRHDYREGFRRGYAVGVQHIYGNNPYGPR